MTQTTLEKAESPEGEVVQVFLPYRAGLPPLGKYFSALWARRDLLRELTRSSARAEHLNTWLGRIWNILNPMFLGVVYLLLVLILARGASIQYYLAYLLCGLFLFEAFSRSVIGGSVSVTSNPALVTNASMPRALLPLSAVRLAFSRYLYAIPILLIVALVIGVRPQWTWLACIPLLVLLVVFCLGAALLMATLQVYLQDTRNLLQYVVRASLFLSPILWTPMQAPELIKPFVVLNPLYSLIGGFTGAFVQGLWPPPSYWIAGSIWAVGMLLIGSYIFLSREREFGIKV